MSKRVTPEFVHFLLFSFPHFPPPLHLEVTLEIQTLALQTEHYL